MHGATLPCRGAYAEAVLVYGDNAQQSIVATVMEKTDNFTCEQPSEPPSGKLIIETCCCLKQWLTIMSIFFVKFVIETIVRLLDYIFYS